jgi:hypothetical protein
VHEGLLRGVADRAREAVQQQEAEDPPDGHEAGDRHERDAEACGEQQRLRDELDLAEVVPVGQRAAVEREHREGDPVGEDHHPEPERGLIAGEPEHQQVADDGLHAVPRRGDPARGEVPAVERDLERGEAHPRRLRGHRGEARGRRRRVLRARVAHGARKSCVNMRPYAPAAITPTPMRVNSGRRMFSRWPWLSISPRWAVATERA